jgi:hypothetical protein
MKQKRPQIRDKILRFFADDAAKKWPFSEQQESVSAVTTNQPAIVEMTKSPKSA